MGVLEGQWALITGASKGIGYGITEKFVGAGANVVLVARDPTALAEAETRLRESVTTNQQLIIRSCDTSDPAAVIDLFGWVATDLPGLNALVANAGSGGVLPFLDLELADWNHTIALNLTGSFLCMQRAARIMVGMPEGTNRSIIAISSIRALGIRPGLGAYAASKAGLNQLVRMAAYELASTGIRVNALSPGVTLTPLAARNPDLIAERIKGIPIGRAGTAGDMAEAALFLCSPASQFVTGTNMVVDGGESLY